MQAWSKQKGVLNLHWLLVRLSRNSSSQMSGFHNIAVSVCISGDSFRQTVQPTTDEKHRIQAAKHCKYDSTKDWMTWTCTSTMWIPFPSTVCWDLTSYKRHQPYVKHLGSSSRKPPPCIRTERSLAPVGSHPILLAPWTYIWTSCSTPVILCLLVKASISVCLSDLSFLAYGGQIVCPCLSIARLSTCHQHLSPSLSILPSMPIQLGLNSKELMI